MSYAFPDKYVTWVLVWNGAYCTGNRMWGVDPTSAIQFPSRARALEHAATYEEKVREKVQFRRRVLTVPGTPPEGEER